MSSTLKTVFITGASSGIGYALASEFAKRGGYKVYAGARTVSKMASLEELGVTVLHLDITSNVSIEKAKQLIISENGNKLDILFNNAGIATRSPVFDLTSNDVRNVFDVNFFGHIEVIKAFKEMLLKSKGLVAFTDSVINLVPIPFSAAYTTSKGAFSLLAQTLALEVNNLGIKVLSVKAGAVASDIGDDGSLSPDSVFYLEDENILSITSDKKTPASEFAKKVVDQVESSVKGNTLFKTTYIGKGATLARLLSSILPFWLYSILIIRVLGLKEAYRKIAQRNSKPKTS